MREDGTLEDADFDLRRRVEFTPYRMNTRRLMGKYNAIYARPPRPARCWIGGIFREHEYYLRSDRPLTLADLR